MAKTKEEIVETIVAEEVVANEDAVATEDAVEVVLNQAPVERQDPGNKTRAYRG